jgi:hypothetical protein
VIPKDLGEIWEQLARAPDHEVGDLAYFPSVNEDAEMNPLLGKIISVGVVDLQVEVLGGQDTLYKTPLLMITPRWKSMGRTRVH